MSKTPFRDALFETLKENPECQKGLRAAAEKLVRRARRYQEETRTEDAGHSRPNGWRAVLTPRWGPSSRCDCAEREAGASKAKQHHDPGRWFRIPLISTSALIAIARLRLHADGWTFHEGVDDLDRRHLQVAR